MVLSTLQLYRQYRSPTTAARPNQGQVSTEQRGSYLIVVATSTKKNSGLCMDGNRTAGTVASDDRRIFATLFGNLLTVFRSLAARCTPPLWFCLLMGGCYRGLGYTGRERGELAMCTARPAPEAGIELFRILRAE